MAAAGQRGEFGTSLVHLAHSIHLLIQRKTDNLRGLIAAPLKSPLGYFSTGQRGIFRISMPRFSALTKSMRIAPLDKSKGCLKFSGSF